MIRQIFLQKKMETPSIKMKLFETIKLNLAKCLYFPNQTNLFNKKRLVVILMAFMAVVSFNLFLFCKANSVIEYVRSAYMSVTLLGIFISFLNTIFKTEIIFALIDINIGETIMNSEYYLTNFMLSFKGWGHFFPIFFHLEKVFHHRILISK